MKVKYYKDADLLSLRISKKHYYTASQSGDVIVHLSKDGEPVLIEILNAGQFLKKAEKSLSGSVERQRQAKVVYIPSVPHRIK